MSPGNKKTIDSSRIEEARRRLAKNIPSTWKLTTLGDMFKWGSGGTPKRGEPSYYGGKIPWIVIGDLTDGVVCQSETTITEEGLKNSSAKWVEPGSILLAMYGSIGKLGIAGCRLTTNQAIAFTLPDPVDRKYLFYYLLFMRHDLANLGKGATQKNISQTVIKSFPFVLAPPVQQKRVVAEIEKQFSRLDEGVDNLKRVQANLKRYKAAVLKAAVEGRLVETEAEIARREGRDYETGEQLLQRILQERRRRWEEAELAKMKAKGKTPKNDKWKQKYKEPAAPDTTNLPELPEGWVWATADLIAKIVGGGTPSKKHPDYWVDGTIPWVSPKDMKSSKIFDSTDHITETALRNTNLKIIPAGSVLVVTRSGILAHTLPVAVTAISVTVNQDIKAFVINKSVSEEYLALVLRAFSQEILNKCSKHGTTVASIDTHAISRFPLPFPPLAEQHRIVTEVDRRLSILRETEAQVEANLQRAERLRQSILAAAFSGQLVSDDKLDPAA